MDYYTPQKPRDDFIPALIGFILAMVLSVLAGCFLGYGVTLYLGNDPEVGLTYTYTERMAAAKTAFADHTYAFQLVTAQLAQTPGVRILRARDGGAVVVDAQGAVYSPEEYFTQVAPVQAQSGQTVTASIDDEGHEVLGEATGGEAVEVTAQDVLDAVDALFAPAEQFLPGYEDSAGDGVTDVYLRHITAGGDGNVYFYLYYDYAGFVSVAYNPAEDFSQRIDPIRIISQWYFDYAYDAKQV